MALTPEEERAERKQVREDQISAREEDRKERAGAQDLADRQSKRTVVVGIIAGAMGLVGGLGRDALDTLGPKEAKPAYTVQVSSSPFDDKSRTGLLRLDASNGATWYSRTNSKGELEWVRIIDQSQAALPAPVTAPPSAGASE